MGAASSGTLFLGPMSVKTGSLIGPENWDPKGRHQGEVFGRGSQEEGRANQPPPYQLEGLRSAPWAPGVPRRHSFHAFQMQLYKRAMTSLDIA